MMRALEILETFDPPSDALERYYPCYICGRLLTVGELVKVWDVKTDSIHYVHLGCREHIESAQQE